MFGLSNGTNPRKIRLEMASEIRFYCLCEKLLQVPIYPMHGKSAQTRVGLTKTGVETYRDEISKNVKHRSIEKCFFCNICTATLFISPKSKQILAVQGKTCFLCAYLPLLTLPKNNILCFFIDVYSPFLSSLSVAYFFMYNLVGYFVDSFRRLYIPLSMNLVACFAIFYVYIQFRISDY
jgi:hypothetical protein